MRSNRYIFRDISRFVNDILADTFPHRTIGTAVLWMNMMLYVSTVGDYFAMKFHDQSWFSHLHDMLINDILSSSQKTNMKRK